MDETPADPHPPSAELAGMGLCELARALAAGETTSAELTTALIARVDAVDASGPVLRAVLALAPDALEQAEGSDRERRAGRSVGALAGIPVLVKDNIDTAGLASTAGSLALSTPPPDDATLVRQLREAGAVVVGKANLSEWANFRSQHSSSGWSAVGGQTRNPHALDRSPSGSSSGSAAAVAAGLVPVAVGTETDGSILSPAAVCGVVGVKPTVGLVSRAGIVPIAASQDTAGPIGRSVEDVAILLDVLAGPDPRDEASASRPPGSPEDYAACCRPGALRGSRLGVLREGCSGYHDGADACFEAALEVLVGEGAVLVDPVEVPGMREFASEDELTVLCYEFHAGLDAYLTARASETGEGLRSLAQVIAFNADHAEAEMGLFGQELFERSAATGGLDDASYLEARARCREKTRARGIDLALASERLDALVALTTAPAWLIDHVNGDSFLGAGYGLAAVAGYPSLTVPIGTVKHLPVGLCLIGPAFGEARLFGLASGLESVLGLRLRPRYSPLGTLA